jgi:hypothetical protein
LVLRKFSKESEVSRVIKIFPLLLVFLLGLWSPNAHADSIRKALVSLCDPAKIATISADRGANPRVRKIAYWLEMARRDGREPSKEMNEVMVAVGWGDSAKGSQTAEAMVRNRIIAERLGCLDEEGMNRLRSGKAPTIRSGPYAGDKLSVDHIIPRSVCPELDTTLANLELMPLKMNREKSSSIGQRQVDMAKKFHAAGLLSNQGLEGVLSR